jgi:hypothetical protein
MYYIFHANGKSLTKNLRVLQFFDCHFEDNLKRFSRI